MSASELKELNHFQKTIFHFQICHPELDSGSINAFITSLVKPIPLDKSLKDGLFLVIKFIFHCLFQFFNCFSLFIAAFIFHNLIILN